MSPRAKGGGTNTRTDLMTPRLPAGITAPDQAYGKRTAQAQSMKIVAPGAPPPAGAVPGAQAPAPANPSAAPAAPPVLPGQIPWTSPTTHGLPPTTGRPYGPGAGPEALTGSAAAWHANQSTEQGTLQTLLSGLAQRPGASSIVKSLASNAGA